MAGEFATEGSGLQRYAQRLRGVEINSTFYRSHRPSTYARWVASTPPEFRFAVKVPRAITHAAKLLDCGPALAAFVDEVRGLGKKLGVLLVQLPPSLAFDPAVAGDFFAALRGLAADQALACEPRHPSWFDTDAEALLTAFQVARVAADPARHPLADRPGGWPDLEYHRLHGSPRMYYSAYGRPYLERLAGRLASSSAAEVWCMFDNTTTGAATANALELADLIG